MPELPEVETIRGQLAPVLEGRRIVTMQVLDPRWSAPLAPSDLAEAVSGRTVLRLGRKGKYLIWELEGEVHLVQHLRMSGAILLEPHPSTPHQRVRITLRGPRGKATHLAIVDQRRFGTAQLLFGREALDAFFAARLGPEPFQPAFATQYLWSQTRGRKAPIKAFLLDQKQIAGIGNIYADEALFRARTHPAVPAGSLTKAQCERLRQGVIDALGEGIDAKGASIDDFRHIDGVSGSFQDRFLVHRRAGKPCPRCGRQIVKIAVAGRGTYVCERCQRPPRGNGADDALALSALRRQAARPAGRSGRPPASR
jgi:formamidopyrimidine-DNA glycosylase